MQNNKSHVFDKFHDASRLFFFYLPPTPLMETLQINGEEYARRGSYELLNQGKPLDDTSMDSSGWHAEKKPSDIVK